MNYKLKPLEHPRISSRGRRGFSLIELMIAVVILGFLALVAQPRLARSYESTTARSAASVIAADVEAAFATASRGRRPVTLSCTCGSRQYQVADQTGGTVRLLRKLDGQSGVSISSLSFSPASIVIGSNGLATSGDTIVVTVGNSTKRVIVSRTGLVRILSS